jgi:ABC-type lipoprotein release transport system permease subunit
LETIALALRSLRRSPAFTAVGIVTTALSMGVAAAVAAMLNAVRNRVVPIAEHERAREVTLGIALGARPRDIVREVSRDAALIVVGGTATGGILALWVSRVVDPLIFDQFHVDAWSLVAAEVVLALTACIASLEPLRRAMKPRPQDILRAV